VLLDDLEKEDYVLEPADVHPTAGQEGLLQVWGVGVGVCVCVRVVLDLGWGGWMLDSFFFFVTETP
jgi:hypothetical protein